MISRGCLCQDPTSCNVIDKVQPGCEPAHAVYLALEIAALELPDDPGSAIHHLHAIVSVDRAAMIARTARGCPSRGIPATRVVAGAGATEGLVRHGDAGIGAVHADRSRGRQTWLPIRSVGIAQGVGRWQCRCLERKSASHQAWRIDNDGRTVALSNLASVAIQAAPVAARRSHNVSCLLVEHYFRASAADVFA